MEYLVYLRKGEAFEMASILKAVKTNSQIGCCQDQSMTWLPEAKKAIRLEALMMEKGQKWSQMAYGFGDVRKKRLCSRNMV